jgi:CRP-like cAMP-binding protein
MRKTLTIMMAMAVGAVTLQAFGPADEEGTDSVRPHGSESAVPVLSSFPSELTPGGLVSLANGNYVIQMGAFSRLTNAEWLKKKIVELSGLPVDIIEESGLFKVFINGSLRGVAPCLYIPVDFPGTGVMSAAVEKKTGPAVSEVTATAEVPAATGEETVTVQDTTTQAITEKPQSVPATAIIPVSELQGAQLSVTPAETEKAELQPAERSIRNLWFLTGNSPWLKNYNYFGKSVALVNALIITIIASFATMLILLLVILLNRRRMEKEAKLRQYLLEQYQSLIIDYLFGSSGPEPFRKIASDNYRRQVLIDQMIDVSVNLKGDSREKLTKLYNELELVNDSLARARSRRWHKRIKGFRELAFMGIREGNDEMYKSLNSRNEILRMEAQIALVRLSEKDHFEFLSHLNRPFSLWEQITLHDLILQHELPVPDFRRWLSSENPTVVMFALRMIREFRQMEAEAEMRKVLLHRDPRVSRLAVEVAGDLGLKSTLETMKRMYKFQEYNNCLEIVKSMGKMPETAMLGFLKLVLDKEDDVQLQIEAVKAIENMGEVGVQALVKVMKSEYKNYNIIVRHVLDRRIY